MKQLSAVIVIFCLSLLCISCGQVQGAGENPKPATSPSNALSIRGSTTLMPIVQKAIEEFKKEKPEINVTFNSSGSQIGINALIDGYADVALSSRELRTEEKQKLHARHRDAKVTIVAWDGIIPVVHPSNTVDNLTISQLKDIYTGKVTDWQQVGGKPGKIVVVSRDRDSGTHEAWADLVLGGEAVADGGREGMNSEEVIEIVSKSQNAIGYDGIGFVTANNKVKALSVDGTKATEITILDKSFKIARPLYLISSEYGTTAVVAFTEFLTSEKGQSIVKDSHFIPLPVSKNAAR